MLRKSHRENESQRKNIIRTSFSVFTALSLCSLFPPKVFLWVSIPQWPPFSMRWLEMSQFLTTTGILRFSGCLLWSPNNHFQLSLLFPAFLFCILVLMTTERVRLETHQNSTEKVRYLLSWESTHAVSVRYHHFVLLLSWLWKLAGFK